MPFTYDYPRMLVTVDALVVLEDAQAGQKKILLIKRKHEPFKGCYALPGGFPEMDERLLEAAKRELFEESGLTDVELKLLGVFDKPDRDPRGRNVTVVYTGTTTPENSTLTPGDDASEAGWFDLKKLPPLAFDHGEIVRLWRITHA